MDTSAKPLKMLYNDDGSLYAVLVGPELWSRVRPEVLQARAQMDEAPRCQGGAGPEAVAEHKPAAPEPLKDWEELKRFWDFQYPVDLDVACEHCGQSTEDWSVDDPRLFRLSAANLGGLVSFICQSCGSRVIKRHFKDTITTECHPPCNQDPRKMGCYDKTRDSR